jgi:NDP-sugar pyrophosphorylase family protein
MKYIILFIFIYFASGCSSFELEENIEDRSWHFGNYSFCDYEINNIKIKIKILPATLYRNKIIDSSGYIMEGAFFDIGGNKFYQKFDELQKYRCLFYEPNPEYVEVNETGEYKIVSFHGGDGAGSFCINVYIKNGRVDYWLLGGGDIKDSPIRFTCCAPN